MAQILVVDDNEDIHTVVEALLGFQHDVVAAQSVAEALELLQQHNPTVVILDYTMPTYDGDDIARMVRRIRPNCKIVAFSAHTSRHIDADKWADAYVSKEAVAELDRVVVELSRA